jgi:hypothetical protein
MPSLTRRNVEAEVARRALEQEERMERYRRGHDPGTRWRTGKKVGRTIYAVTTGERLRPLPDDEHPLIGIMDTPELAAEAVRQHNLDIDIRCSR